MLYVPINLILVYTKDKAQPDLCFLISRIVVSSRDVADIGNPAPHVAYRRWFHFA